MDYKAALMKEIPSSSPKLNHRQQINPNWLNLPQDIMVVIMQRIGWYDVLMNVEKVCKYWYMLSKDQSIWRVIEFRQDVLATKLREDLGFLPYKDYREYEANVDGKVEKVPYKDYREYEDNVERKVEKALHKMVMHVVDLSWGELHDLCIQGFGSDNLFKYIYQRSRQLRRLRLETCFVCCYNYETHDYDRDITLKGMIQMLRNLPFLEELELPYTRIFGKGIEIVGRCCPHLKSFTLNQRSYYYSRNPECDKQALAIAKSMPGLRHLQLFGNRMTITGLMAILNNCHYLEYLDLRQCYGLCITLEDEPDLEIKLRQQIKHVRFPKDSTEDYEFDDSISDSDDSDGYIIGSDCSDDLD